MRLRASGFGATPHTERGEDRPHILVVDGSLALRMDLRAALHGAGFHVTACESRAAARQALRVRGYAVAIVDAHLPDGSGLDLVKEIRAAHPGLRSIMISPDADPRQKATAVAAGAEDLFGKPIDMVPLLRCAVKLAGGPPKSRPSEAPRSPLRARRILVVDADPVFRRALAESLRSDGEEVLTAGSAEEAIALLSVDRVDGVVVDFRLPELGGLELCRRIRRESLQRQVPIMVVARPSDDVDAYRKAMGAGADDLVVRSKEPAMVKVRVRGLVSRMQRERERPGGLEARSPLDEMSAALVAPPRRTPSPPKGRPKSVPSAPSSYRPPAPSSYRPPAPSSLRAAPPPSFFPEIPSPPSSSPVLRQRRDEPDSNKVSSWSFPREAGDDRSSGAGLDRPLGAGPDRGSGVVQVGPPASRDGRSQPSARRGTSAGSK